MDALRTLKVQKIKHGIPLYRAVSDALREAIETGIFQPGNRMPSTKLLSEQLDVSLVTAHRALQELVGTGVLQRAQGRGTYVHEQFRDRLRISTETRIGLIINADVSLADSHHAALMEGIRRAATESGADVVFLRFGEDVRSECGGYLLISPLEGQIRTFTDHDGRKPVVVLDSSAGEGFIQRIRTEPGHICEQAIQHLTGLKHRRIGYVGGNGDVPRGADLWEAFTHVCQQHKIEPHTSHIVLRPAGWMLDETGIGELTRMLRSNDRPTAIVASGYGFAIDIYSAAAVTGLKIPKDISVICLDSPRSAEFLSPALSAVQQPLMEMAGKAVQLLVSLIHNEPILEPADHLFPTRLHERQSTAAPHK